MPSAMTLSSSTIRTLAILDLNHGGCRAYEELRVGFTAAVSHELRTPLARLLVILETAALPGTDRDELLSQAREEVEEMAELVERRALSLGARERSRGRRPRETPKCGPSSRRSVPGSPIAPSGPRSRFESRRSPGSSCRSGAECCRSIAENLAENAIRYAGPGSTVTLRRRGRRAAGRRRRTRSGGRGAPASLRALLPQRPGARLAWHRASGWRSSSTSSSPPGAKVEASGGPGGGCRWFADSPPLSRPAPIRCEPG